jgi:endonuclease G
VARIADLHSGSPMPSPLVQEFLDDVNNVRPIPGTTPQGSVIGPPVIVYGAVLTAAPPPQVIAATGAPQAMAVITPIGADQERRQGPQRNLRQASHYAGRKGYDRDFLGVRIDLPVLTERALKFGEPAVIHGQHDPELRYTHFSVVFNATRRLAFYTAVNIDGTRWEGLDRDNDRWFYDPRLAIELQVGDELYGNEPSQIGNKGWFDRGHLVRRLDPVWGALTVAKTANDDTFHWTNCAPQYWGFNQGQELWQGLENFILYNTDDEDVRASVFTGPVFQHSDEEHRGIQIPQHFWKVVVVSDRDDNLYSSAYVVSQAEYATDIPFERMPVGAYNQFQISITKLENSTGLQFPAAVRDADVFLGETADRPLRGFSDIQHPRR